MNLYSSSSLLAGFFCLGLSLFVYLKKGLNPERRSFSAVTLLIGIWTLFPYLTSQSPNAHVALIGARAVYVAALFVPSLFFEFMLHTMQIAHEQREQLILKRSYLVASIFLLFIGSPLFIRQTTFGGPYYAVRAGSLYPVFVVYFAYMYFHASIRLYQLYQQATGHFREHLKYIGLAFVLAFLAGTLHFASSFGLPEFIPHDFLVISYSAIIAFAIVRYRIMDLRAAITRTAVFMIVYTAVLGLPLLAALSWQPQLEKKLGPRWWTWLWVASAGLATGAHYMNQYFQRRAEARLLAEQKRYQGVLRQAAQGMTLIKDLGKLLRLIVHLLTRKVRLKHAAIYLWDAQERRFVSKTSRQWPRAKSPPAFQKEDPLPDYLQWHRVPLITEELQLKTRGGEKELQPVVAALKSMDAAVLVPSFAEDRCKGFMILGEKVSGALYSTDDLQVFEVLASQAALAIENAEFYEELKKTQTDLFQTAKMASLGHMAGGMSHQINNRFHVLTILAGTLKSVMKGQDPATMEQEKLRMLWDKTLETLTKLEDNALRGGDIVKTLLRFSRPAGEHKPVTVKQILSTAKEVVQFRVDMASIDYTEEVPENLPEVSGDLNQLADCCFNLITNAYDAIQKKAQMIQEGRISPGPDDPVPFKARLGVKAFTEAKGDQAWVVIQLQDNGTGMNQEELDSLFVPFFTTKATAQKGTGLGLYVIQRILERHGGTISATSKYGAGTTFSMRIPALPAKPAETPKTVEKTGA